MTFEVIRDELIYLIQNEIGPELSVTQIDNATFVEMGLDSEKLIFITGLLSDRLGVDIDPVLVYENPTVDQLADAVQKLLLVGGTN